MIDFYTFVPQFGARNASPFCLKLEAYLALAGIKHNRREIMDPRIAPKQKMPFIKDQGESIGDSEIIIDYLKQTYGDTLGEGLTAEQTALTHIVNVMLAERYYWTAMIIPRWVKPEHHDLLTRTWFKDIPAILRGFITRKIYKDVAKGAIGHGIGKHSDEEIYAFGIKDVKALADILGDQDFMLGDKPREIDAAAYAFLDCTLSKPFKTPIRDYVESQPALMAYIRRVDALVFPSG